MTYSINFKTGILILMPSVPNFEDGIPRCTRSHFRAHIPWAWRLKNTSVFQVIRVVTRGSAIWMKMSSLGSATLISRTFSGISLCVNHVIDIGVTRQSKFPINILNKFRSTMERGVYAYVHRRRILSADCNFLHDLGPYCFPEFVNACMIPFEVVGVFPISTSFRAIHI